MFEAVAENQTWARATEVAANHFGAASCAGLELIEPDRIVVQGAYGNSIEWPGSVMPVAPDSQAARVLSTATTVRSDDLRTEKRFVPARLLLSAGIRSAMSCRFDLPDDRWGMIGVYATDPGSFDDDDEKAFTDFAAAVGMAVRQSRVRSSLVREASHDPLTDLVNRTALVERLDHVISAGVDSAALLIDLDGFKTVNDDHGHQIGDIVLAAVAKRIDRAIGPDDLCGRLGGDEFLVLSSKTSPADLGRLCEGILSGIEEIIRADTHSVQLSASIGVAFTAGRFDPSAIIDAADRLMFSAKSHGRGTIRIETVVSPTMTVAKSVPPMAVQTDAVLVDEAIADLRVLFQPIVDASTGILTGVEALTRGPVGHPLEFPDVLFPAAATHGRLGDLELEAKRLAFAADLPPNLTLFVNLEPSVLCDSHWIRRMTEVWDRACVDRHVVAELTERAVLASPGGLLAAVEACRAMGWQIALDDVGSRSESLAALRCVRPDVVKLDIGLIHGRNAVHAAHVAVTIAGYRAVNDVSVIAEGVETVAHAEASSILGAELLQGYLLGRPMPAADLDVGHISEVCTAPDTRLGLGERLATKKDLLHISRHIESTVLASDSMLLASLQRAQFLTDRTRRQYQALARRCGFIGLVGVGLSSESGAPLEGVRLADLDVDDPMAQTWNVVVLSPTISLAVTAVEVDPMSKGPDMDRLFRYRLLTEPTEVEAAARRLLEYF